jgi:GTP-binding protein EngB required for normal cell division
MSPTHPQDIDGLVREVAELTASDLPALAKDDAPVLHERALAAVREEEPFYLVGLIGGKEVGKSALVNALVGQKITVSTSFGPGTETVVAYAHRAQEEAMTRLLEREVPRRFRVITHDNDALRSQVLLDLPDVDSHYADHLETTRRMLRHMLFPLWIQSIEKYADQQPQRLLSAVAAGNDPANFVFCLNKVDQIDPASAEDLRQDFAARLARTLNLESPPRVFLISATHPQAQDLPALRQLLSRQKTQQSVRNSVELAVRQRNRSVLAWLDDQRLPAQSQRLNRLETEAEELLATRLGVPLLEEAIPRLLDDARFRSAIADEAMDARVSRWPIVNVLHVALLSPLTSIWRVASASAPPAEALVAGYVDPQDRPVAGAVRTSFAHLHQSHPSIASLYERRRLWEDLPADEAADDLRRRLVTALEGQRSAALARLTGRRGVIGPVVRFLLTVGAVLWFPFIQPVLEAFLQDSTQRSIRQILLLAVQMLGAAYLLKTVSFLLIWFVLLWLLVRWNTQRRTARLLKGLRCDDLTAGASTSPTRATIQWLDDLLEPIRTTRARLDGLIDRTERLRSNVSPSAAA